MAEGVDGLLRDKTRPSRIPPLGPEVAERVITAILLILSAKGINLLLCAPTGRAAKRMSEATGQEAKTIHRLLEVDPKAGGFRKDRGQSARLRSAGRRRNLHD